MKNIGAVDITPEIRIEGLPEVWTFVDPCHMQRVEDCLNKFKIKYVKSNLYIMKKKNVLDKLKGWLKGGVDE